MVGGGAALAQDVASMSLPDAPGFVAAAASAPVAESSSAAMTANVSADMSAGAGKLAPVDAAGGAGGGFGQASIAKPTGKMAGPLDKYIQPGETAPKLTIFDKSLLGAEAHDHADLRQRLAVCGEL